MSAIVPEFSRSFAVETIGDASRAVAIEADAGERAALAARFDLAAVDRLAAEARLARRGGAIVAEGRVTAAVVQRCVVTGDRLPVAVDEEFSLRFLPEPEAAEDEIELGAEDVDTVFYRGAAIDLGEAVAETMALALDPFPRAPGAGEALRAAGVIGEEEAGPFGALKALKDRLGGAG